MALLKAVILTSKTIKGGRNKVRISVAHNGETRYIVTDIIIDSNKEFKNGAIVKRPDAAYLNTKLRTILQKYQSALDEIDYVNGLSCPELVNCLLNAGNNKHRTLKSVCIEYIDNAHIKPRTAKQYKYTWSNIEQFAGDKLLVEHITHGTLLGFEKFLWGKKLTPTTVRSNVSFLIALLNYAKRCGYVQFRVDPVIGYKLPKPEIRDAWLSVDEIRSIRDLDCKKKNIIKCRDLFMLSYYLGGINIGDLLDINFKENPNTLCYTRKKTDNQPKLNKFVQFDIPDEAKAILARRIDKNGFLNVTKSDRKRNCTDFLANNIKKLAEAAGIEYLIYYSARKSFSQHAFNLGISTCVIDYILGHSIGSGGKSLYSYITVTPEMATKAIRQVLDNLK